MPSSAKFPPAKLSTQSSTTTPLTSIPKFVTGSSGTRAGFSTSRPLPAHGSTPSRTSSPPSLGDASSAASSNLSSTSRPPSNVTSINKTQPPSQSFGPIPPM